MFKLDIFGAGPERETLEKILTDFKVSNVQLKGPVSNLESCLFNYDAFILASRYEGFGLAPLEAAAVGLPLLLSDIQVFKEITNGLANYFRAEDINGIAEQTEQVFKNYERACIKAEELKSLVAQKYSRPVYIEQLLGIYNS